MYIGPHTAQADFYTPSYFWSGKYKGQDRHNN